MWLDDQSTKSRMFGRKRSTDSTMAASSLHSFGIRRRTAGFKKKSSSLDASSNVALSTTKAHLISIVAPRLFTPASLFRNDKDPATDITVATNKTISTDSSEEPKGVTSSKVTFHDEVKKVDPSSKENAGYSAAEMMASPFTYAARGLSKNVKEEDKSLDQESLSSFEESRDDEDDDEEGAEVTPEEAEGIKRNDELDNTEVNVEHLLRVAFRKLFKEKHLVSAPTFTIIDGPAFDNKCPTVDASSWIQIEVMCLPPAIGIILQRLERIGVGHDVGSVSIYKAELCKASSLSVYEQAQQGKVMDDSDHTVQGETNQATLKSIEAAMKEWTMAATRLRIEQVREQIVESSEFNFDFIALLTIAGILAGVGLITNNTVVIVASMLVSPIMGPVMGMTFGARIDDWPLVRSSFLVETKAIIVCFLVGAVITLCAGFTELANTWPTNEMQIRGEVSGLYVGIAIAIPSGMGVALSILGGNTGSLVGVAISASLLPPAVNAGICWMYAILELAGGVTSESEDDANFGVIGAISFTLTVVNIVCIWFSGMLMSAIKEVAPLKKKSAFWERYLKAARKMNRNNPGHELPPPPPTLLEERQQAAFDIFSFMPFQRNTPMEVTVKHNQRAIDSDRPPLVGGLSAANTYGDEAPEFDHEEEEDYNHDDLMCFGNLAHLFGLDEEDRATFEAASQSYDSRGTYEDEIAIKAAEDEARRRKNLKFMYYRKPAVNFEAEDAA